METAINFVLRVALVVLLGDSASLLFAAARDSSQQTKQAYSREKDVKWYAEQQALWLLDLERIDERIAVLRNFRKAGRTRTSAIALESDDEGLITPESGMAILEKKRGEILTKADQLEDVAHRHDMPPGEIRFLASRLAEKIKNSPPPLPPAPPAAPDLSAEMAKDPEGYWRKKFADARERLYWNEKELSILQRELSQAMVQMYPDAHTALIEQITLNRINRYRRTIEQKRSEVTQLRQALSDLEDDLRRAGGYPGWAR